MECVGVEEKDRNTESTMLRPTDVPTPHPNPSLMLEKRLGDCVCLTEGCAGAGEVNRAGDEEREEREELLEEDREPLPPRPGILFSTSISHKNL